MIEIKVQHGDDLGPVAEILTRLGAGEPQINEPLNRVSVPVFDGISRLSDAVVTLSERAIALDDISLRRPTLDEVFLTLTGDNT